MDRYTSRRSLARKVNDARAALRRLESELSSRSSGGMARVARLCEMVERDLGRDAGVGEKLGLVLSQARRLELGAGLTESEARQATLIALSSCSSLRGMLERRTGEDAIPA